MDNTITNYNHHLFNYNELHTGWDWLHKIMGVYIQNMFNEQAIQRSNMV